MLALMYHLLYLRSRLSQTSYVGLNVFSLYIEEQFIKRVALGTPDSIVNSTVKKDLFAGFLWKTQGFSHWSLWQWYLQILYERERHCCDWLAIRTSPLQSECKIQLIYITFST